MGKEENLLDIFYDEINSIIEIFKDKEINEFINDRFIKVKDKKNLLNRVLKDINKYILNFINLIIDDDKTYEIEEILNGFKELYYRENNVVNGIVYCLEIDEDKIRKLEEIFGEKLKKKVCLKFKKDISLIGGYKVVVDNKLYDNSYKNKLDKLESKLLKEGE